MNNRRSWRKRHILHTFAIVLSGLTACIIMTACGNAGRNGETTSSYSDSLRLPGALLPADRVLVDSVRVDLDGDGIPELVIASRLRESSVLHQDMFDRVDLLSVSGRNLVVLFTDVVDYGVALSSRDVTGDGILNLIAELDAGGNTPITSQGMHVYGLTMSGRISLLFHIDNGAPEFHDLDNDGCLEILVSDQYWGLAPHSESIGFVRGVYYFTGSMYVKDNKRFSAWFDSALAQRRRMYSSLKQNGASGEDDRNRLYLAAVDYLLWTWVRYERKGVETVWKTENALLRSLLSSEHYDDLASFVGDVAVMEYEQREYLP